MKSQVFIHKFSVGGLCATMTIFPQRMVDRKSGGIVCNWNRKPTPAQLDAIGAEYLAWKRDILQPIANAIGGTILDVVQIGPDSCVAQEIGPEVRA